MGPKRPDSIGKRCRCENSRCVNNYCSCYSNLRICSEACSCSNCTNTDSSVFSKKSQEELQKTGCECSMSKCTHPLCRCVKAGVACSNRCRCVGCENVNGRREDKSEKKSEMGKHLKLAPSGLGLGC